MLPRRYLGNRFYFLFLELLRCFSSLGTLFRATDPEDDRRIEIVARHAVQLRFAGVDEPAADDEAKEDNAPAFVKELVRPINGQAGDLLKVSDFVKHNTVDL